MRDVRRITVARLLRDRPTTPGHVGEAFAPANIALCKYWGKRDAVLNLPVTSSLSVSLGKVGTQTRIEPDDAESDTVLVGPDKNPAPPEFAARAGAFLDLFRPAPDVHFRIHTINHLYTGAGFASSASGFAALTLALDRLFGWELDRVALSILARLGSGSACRSVYEGFVEWSAGVREDGLDSHALKIPAEWPSIRLALLALETRPKTVGSRAGMNRTTETSPLYAAWPNTVKRDMKTLRAAIDRRDLATLGATAEGNALAMHATLLASRPAVLYWQPETVQAIHRVRALRESGLPVWFTMDAGPNVKLLFEQASTEGIRKAFPAAQMTKPFGEKK